MVRHSTSVLGVALAALGMLVSPVVGQAWVMSEGMAITMSRVDPIVNPGGIAGHVHNVLGASKFSQNLLSPADQLSSKCSSLNVQADKSNYWVPQLYYRYKDNTMAPMLGSARVYYFNNAANIKPFPPGHRMISGMTSTRNVSDEKAFGLLISCNHGAQTSYMPNKTSHPGGCGLVTLGIFFPSCGKADGSLDSDDHFSHMAWPHNYVGSTPVPHVAGEYCPDSHPIHYPSVFVEHNYWFNDAQPWRNEDDLLVLSNGDTTGLAYHGDFHNGWDQKVLTDAINQCVVGDGVSNCPPFAPSVSRDDAWNCRLEGDVPAEDIGIVTPLANLPGCNPVWKASMSDTKPTCAVAPPKPAYVAPNAYFRSDWQRMNIPLAYPNATTDKLTDWYRPTTFKGIQPAPGGGSSYLKVWGSEDTAKYVKVSTAEDVAKVFVGDGDVKLDSPAPASSSSAAASSSASTAAAASSAASQLNSGSEMDAVQLNANPVKSASSSAADSSDGLPTVTVTHSAPAVTVTVADKTCRRSNSKRLLSRKAGEMKDTIRSHVSRRSRRKAVQG